MKCVNEEEGRCEVREREKKKEGNLTPDKCRGLWFRLASNSCSRCLGCCLFKDMIACSATSSKDLGHRFRPISSNFIVHELPT